MSCWISKKTVFFTTFTILLMSIICSCTTTKEVIRDVYHHDSIYVTAVSIDTLIQRDSIHTVERGDTVTTTIYKYIYKVKERVDTVYIERVDTMIQTELRTETKVERKKDWLSIIGASAIAFILGILTLPIYKLRHKV